MFREVAGPARVRPTLTALLAAAVAANADLPIDPSVELAAGIELDPTVAVTMADAVTTLLHNARRHAHAGSVVLHADHDDGMWEVLVADNGVGVDPDTVPLGFGLREQVIRQLAGHAVTVTIESAPGKAPASPSAGVPVSETDEPRRIAVVDDDTVIRLGTPLLLEHTETVGVYVDIEELFAERPTVDVVTVTP